MESPLDYQSPTVRHLRDVPKVAHDPRWTEVSPHLPAATTGRRSPESIDKPTWETVKRERILDAINETLADIECVAPHLLDKDIDQRLYEILDCRVDVEVIFSGTIFTIISRAINDILFNTPELQLAKDRLDHFVTLLDLPLSEKRTTEAVLDVLLLDHVGKSFTINESSIADIQDTLRRFARMCLDNLRASGTSILRASC
jgi:hypothetical protein